ncbi:MAG: heterodisulfide reductase-related iron-sulfur binding cluster, partial [Ferrimicrobium acidiphilum]
AVRDEISARAVRDVSGIAVTVHPACHYYKLVEGDAIFDPDVYHGQRTAAVSGLVLALGADLRSYSTFFDCCGFGFRHILVQRDFTRSFSTLRKIEVMKEEANPDVVLTHDTGCVTALDKSQFAAEAHDRNVGVPVMSEAQFAALAMGAHPFKVAQLHWHSTNYRPLLEKMGIDWRAAWAEFQEDAERLKSGGQEFLTWADVDA